MCMLNSLCIYVGPELMEWCHTSLMWKDSFTDNSEVCFHSDSKSHYVCDKEEPSRHPTWYEQLITSFLPFTKKTQYLGPAPAFLPPALHTVG